MKFLKCDILVYTPGISDAQPTPQVTRPTTVHLPDWAWHTSGEPPSPVQASLPTSAPAHSSLSSSTKLEFLLVLRESACRNVAEQLLRSTRGTSTLCWMNWKDPLSLSLPQPATQHLGK